MGSRDHPQGRAHPCGRDGPGVTVMQHTASRREEAHAMVHQLLGQVTILRLHRSGESCQSLRINRMGSSLTRPHAIQGPGEVHRRWTGRTQHGDGQIEVFAGAGSQNHTPGSSNADGGSSTHGHRGDGFSHIAPVPKFQKLNGIGQTSLIQKFKGFSSPTEAGGQRHRSKASVSCIEDKGVAHVERFDAIRADLIKTMQMLHQRHWCDGTGGNFSVVVQREPLLMLMAPSGVDKGSVLPHQLIVVNGQQDVVDGIGCASAETALHRELIQHAGAGSVLHTHSVQATALSQHYRSQGFIPLEGWEMLKGLAGITTHATRVDLPVVANSQSMEDLVMAFGPHIANRAHGILVAGHGLYAWGKNLAQAQRHVEILEFLLNVHSQQLLLQNR